MRIVSCFLLFVGTTLLAHAQYTLDTLRHMHPRPGTGLSAIWGYTAPDGREYALVGITGSGTGGTSGGTSIVDITDDANPQVVTHINGPNSTWRELKTYRHYAYVVTEASSATGVQIIDLSELPDTARLARTFSYSNGSSNINRSHTISIHDGFMYLNGCAGWSPGGIVIFDLRNDPLNPVYVGQYQPQYIHDSYVLRDTIYASAIYTGGGLIIANAVNKANVQTIAQISYPGSGTHNAWVSKDRRYAMTTDEIGTTQKNLKIWDISNLPTVPTTPTATFTVNPSSTIHNVHVRGDFAYCAWYSGYGLQIANIANPASPVLAAGYNTSTSSLAWETYPYFPSGKVIIGDGSTGLWIFRFSGLAPRVPVTLLQPEDGDSVASGSPITFQWTKSANLNSDPHYYEVHLTGPGLDTTWRANDSVSTFTNFQRLQQGGTYTWRIFTRDEWNETPSPSTSSFTYAGPLSANEPEVPTTYRLEQNFPNPFNPSTVIGYVIPKSGYVSLKIYDVLGQEIATLVSEEQQTGMHQTRWEAQGLSSGVYYYRLQAGTFTDTKKLLLLR
jgi:choice-of-anchor B domain-containing protein